MDNQCSPLLTWAYYSQGKSMDELRQSLLLTTLELETTRLKAEEELKMRDDHLNNLKCLLSEAIRERDEAQDKCRKLFFENILLQQIAPISGISSIEDEPRRGLDSNNGFSSSECEESIISPPPPPPAAVQEPTIPLISDKPLPEKGKLLEAVMKAGPLLQTLLLAGPLPQWRHPPPPLDSYQIPPPPIAIPPPTAPPPAQLLLHQESLLDISSCDNINNNNNNIDNCGRINRKRGPCQNSDPPTETKYRRFALH